jgi:hypothetical protein
MPGEQEKLQAFLAGAALNDVAIIDVRRSTDVI